jgi:hypothetical protein
MNNAGKAVAAFGIRAGAEKFAKGAGTSRSLKVGAVTGASVLMSDTVIGFIPIPGMLSFLGVWSQDVVSSILSALITTMWMRPAGDEGGPMHTAFLKEFLYSMGSTVGAGYVAPAIQPMFNGLARA